MTAATNGAVYRRDDGIVIIDPDKAQGQRDIVTSCPHRVISWNEERNVAQKCTFCAHLLDDGSRTTRCAEACPVDAIVFGDLDDSNSDVSRRRAEVKTEELHPEYSLQPLVTYVGLPKRFIAGEVIFADTPEQCAEGVTVNLRDGTDTQAVVTDNYGDFEFDGLAGGREYTLEIRHTGYESQQLTVRTRADLNLGTIALTPAP